MVAVFLVAVFLVAVFLAAVFLAAVFLVAVFLAAVFLAAVSFRGCPSTSAKIVSRRFRAVSSSNLFLSELACSVANLLMIFGSAAKQRTKPQKRSASALRTTDFNAAPVR
ncbi:MAG TPA: hypothetical protein DER64_07845 [Planctomycetaceae bacterium]|nr:hypothetical protein [Planctomycetaceae bacterium]